LKQSLHEPAAAHLKGFKSKWDYKTEWFTKWW